MSIRVIVVWCKITRRPPCELYRLSGFWVDGHNRTMKLGKRNSAQIKMITIPTNSVRIILSICK
jgi:hypothetical protein